MGVAGTGHITFGGETEEGQVLGENGQPDQTQRTTGSRRDEEDMDQDNSMFHTGMGLVNLEDIDMSTGPFYSTATFEKPRQAADYSKTFLMNMPSLRLMDLEAKSDDPLVERVKRKYCGDLAWAEFYRFYRRIQKDRQHFTPEQVRDTG